MGQEEVFNFLKNERAKGNDKFFNVTELRKMINGNCWVFRQVNQLYIYDYLEIKTVKHRKLFRIKKKYV